MDKNFNGQNKVISEMEYENLYKRDISEKEIREISLEGTYENTKKLYDVIRSRMDANLYELFLEKTSLSIASSITILMRDLDYPNNISKEEFGLLSIVTSIAIDMKINGLNRKYNRIFEFLNEEFSSQVDYKIFLNFYYNFMDEIGATRVFQDALINYINDRVEYIFGHVEDIYFYNTRNLDLDEEKYLSRFKLQSKSMASIKSSTYDIKWKGYILNDIKERSWRNVKQSITVRDRVNEGESLFYISNYICPHCDKLLYYINTDNLIASIEDDKNIFSISSVYTCPDCKKFYGSVWEKINGFFNIKSLKDFGIESLEYGYMDYYHTLSRVQNFARVDRSRVTI